MKRFILSLGAMAVLFGAMSSPLLAASGHGPSSGHGREVHGSYYGHGGYRSLHRDYRGWRGSYWNNRYGCRYYFCPEASCYYYWYAPSACYLPVSQIDTYPPSINIVNNNNNNVNVGVPMP